MWEALNNTIVLGCLPWVLSWGGTFAKTQKLVKEFSYLHIYSVGFTPYMFINFQKLFPPTRLFGLHVYSVVLSI